MRNISSRPLEVFVVYARSTLRLGSTHLRAIQLADCVKKYGSGKVNINLLSITNMRLPILRKAWCLQVPKGAIVWFCKDAISRLDEDALEFLWLRSAAVLVDHIDRDVRVVERNYVDCHVAISITQKRYFDELLTNGSDGISALLHHQANSFFYQKFERDMQAMNLGYFGALNNCLLPNSLHNDVKILDAEDNKSWNESASIFASCNAHYAVRPHTPLQHRKVFKPLLKAFTAAICNVPVILHYQHDDFSDLLGTEYPYAVDQDDPTTIIGTVDRLKTNWQGAEYRVAMDILSSIAKLVSLEATAKNFEAVVELAIDHRNKLRG